MSAPQTYTVRSLIPKMLPFVRPFWKLVAFSTLANLVFSAANALVLAIVEPVFRTLFGGEAGNVVSTPTVPASASGLKAQFDAFLGSIIASATYGESIRNISILIFVLFFIAVLWYVRKMDKGQVQEIKQLPLDLENENSYVNSKTNLA